MRPLRVAVTLFFAVHGVIYAGWVSRIPAIKAQTGASPGTLGLALLGMSGGAVATMLVTGALCRRFGSRPMTIVTGALFSVTVALPPLAHSALALGLALFVFGIAFGGMNVAMNSVAVDLVAATNRPIMPSFHAAWSFGALAGSAVGGAVAPYLSPTEQLWSIVPVGLAVTAVASRMLMRAPLPVHTQRRAPGAPRAGLAVVIMLGVVALCECYGEGAIGDWGALHLRQDLGAAQGVAAIGFAAYAFATAFGRLGGTALLARLGPTRVLVFGGLTATAGMLLGALAPNIWLAFVGFAITGLGLANMFPTAIAQAGLLAGATGVAIGSTFGYGGLLIGPPTIGFLAGAVGLPTALTTVPLLTFTAAAVAYFNRARPPETAPSASRSHTRDDRASDGLGHGQR